MMIVLLWGKSSLHTGTVVRQKPQTYKSKGSFEVVTSELLLWKQMSNSPSNCMCACLSFISFITKTSNMQVFKFLIDHFQTGQNKPPSVIFSKLINITFHFSFKKEKEEENFFYKSLIRSIRRSQQYFNNTLSNISTLNYFGDTVKIQSFFSAIFSSKLHFALIPGVEYTSNLLKGKFGQNSCLAWDYKLHSIFRIISTCLPQMPIPPQDSSFKSLLHENNTFLVN